MLLALSGVTGVGKTYYTNKISEELHFSKVRTIRTRQMRKGEINGKTGLFMSKDKIDDLENKNKIAYRIKLFGGEYAYLNDDIFSNRDMVFEMHYTMIDDWKRIRPDIKTIYILPNNIEIPIQKTMERNLSIENEKIRIAEIREQYNLFMKDKNLQNKFDYIFTNNYDEDSEKNLINLIKKIDGDN